MMKKTYSKCVKLIIFNFGQVAITDALEDGENYLESHKEKEKGPSWKDLLH